MKREIKNAIYLFDSHLPYEDKRAFNLALDVAEDFQRRYGLHEFGLGGDFADCYAASSYAKSPKLSGYLQDEILAVNKKLDEINKRLRVKNKIFLEGNHEHRLIRLINNHAPSLFGLVTIPKLLHLKDRGYKWIPFGPYQKHRVLGSHLIARHKPLSTGENAAAVTVKKGGASVIFGDIHRIQEYQAVTLDDENHRAISVGWLGDKFHPAFEYLENHAQWAQGFSVTRVLPDGTFFHENVHIIDYKCCVGGKIYKG